MTAPMLRNRYVNDSIATANPAQLLTMLYDRLVLDLQRAEKAQRESNREVAHAQLLHAQDIVLELRSSLEMDTWNGAAGLAGLYTFLLAEMVQANITLDADRTATCRALIEPLRDAWREAATQLAAAAAPKGTTA
jgi:flagellar protein FliS